MKPIKSMLLFLGKNFLTGFIIMLWALVALLGVQAFQSLTTNPSTSGNQSLGSPILSKNGWTFERDTMSLQAISESLWIKKVPKIMFITSQTYDGNLWGLVGADQKCQQLADATGSLPAVKWKKWVALIWDSNIPLKARIPFLHSSIKDVLWNTIFTNNTAINYFLRPEYWYPATFNDNGNNSIMITIDEQWNAKTTKQVWTGANSLWGIWNATAQYSCNNWATNTTSTSYYWHTGYNTQVSSTIWLYYTTSYCNNSFHLYCLEI